MTVSWEEKCRPGGRVEIGQSIYILRPTHFFREKGPVSPGLIGPTQFLTASAGPDLELSNLKSTNLHMYHFSALTGMCSYQILFWSMHCSVEYDLLLTINKLSGQWRHCHTILKPAALLHPISAFFGKRPLCFLYFLLVNNI